MHVNSFFKKIVFGKFRHKPQTKSKKMLTKAYINDIIPLILLNATKELRFLVRQFRELTVGASQSVTKIRSRSGAELPNRLRV